MVFSKIPPRKKVKIAAYVLVIVIVLVYIVSAYITTVTGAKEKFTGDSTAVQTTEADVERRMENLIASNIGINTGAGSITDNAPRAFRFSEHRAGSVDRSCAFFQERIFQSADGKHYKNYDVSCCNRKLRGFV